MADTVPKRDSSLPKTPTLTEEVVQIILYSGILNTLYINILHKTRSNKNIIICINLYKKITKHRRYEYYYNFKKTYCYFFFFFRPLPLLLRFIFTGNIRQPLNGFFVLRIIHPM